MSRALFGLLFFILLLVPFLSFSACGQSEANPEGKGGPHTPIVVSTIFASFDFARQIVGSDENVHMLVPPGSDSHSYEPTPADIRLIKGADIFIYVGGDSDTWVKDILGSMDTSGMRIIRLLDCVPLLDEDEAVAIQDDSNNSGAGLGLDGNVDQYNSGKQPGNTHETDEHVWTSPINAKLIVDKICSALVAVDPANASTYEDNNSAYQAELDKLDAGFRDVVQGSQNHTLVFADRFPFRYMAKEYGLECHAAYPGCSDAAEPSARTVVALIDLIRDKNIPMILSTDLSDERMAATISAETDAQMGTLYACHEISLKKFESGASYLSLMWENIATLKLALK